MRVRLPLLAFSLVLISSLPAFGADDMDFAPVSVEGDKESAGELDEALAAYKKRDWLRASLILHRIVARNEVAVTPVVPTAPCSRAARARAASPFCERSGVNTLMAPGGSGGAVGGDAAARGRVASGMIATGKAGVVLPVVPARSPRRSR